jgi:hypothetical protein
VTNNTHCVLSFTNKFALRDRRRFIGRDKCESRESRGKGKVLGFIQGDILGFRRRAPSEASVAALNTLAVSGTTDKRKDPLTTGVEVAAEHVRADDRDAMAPGLDVNLRRGLRHSSALWLAVLKDFNRKGQMQHFAASGLLMSGRLDGY